MKNLFDDEINILQTLLTEMATEAEQAVRLAVRAVEMRDKALAQSVIDDDNEIDQREIRLEEECLKVLALHQPVAGDLRYVITLMKVNTELERIGDLAVNIAECALHLSRFAGEPPASIDFTAIEAEAIKMLKSVLDALMQNNSLAALEVIKNDDVVDNYHRSLMERIPGLLERSPAAGGYFLNMLTVSRNIERIADCATNIAEDVIYLEQGRIVRHQLK